MQYVYGTLLTSDKTYVINIKANITGNEIQKMNVLKSLSNKFIVSRKEFQNDSVSDELSIQVYENDLKSKKNKRFKIN